jgi:hypothetical protein
LNEDLRCEADVAAAMAVARNVGLTDIRPVVLNVSGHTVVHLAPWPIVARVLSAFTLEQMMPSVRRELALAQHLAARGAPSATPTIDPPPGPHIVGETTVTLWNFVEHRPVDGVADALAAGHALAAVHAAMADFQGQLPLWTDDLDRCAAMLRDQELLRSLRAADRAFLSRTLDDLRAGLAIEPSRLMPLHADAHLGNVFMTATGAIWLDFESAGVGPLEWELTSLPAASRRAFPRLDRPLFRRLSLLRSLVVVVWCAYHDGRGPQLRDAGRYHLRRLRRALGART